MIKIEKSEELNNQILEMIEESGLKRGFIADKMGIAVNSLRRKLIGERCWHVEDIQKLEKILNKNIK